MGERVEPDVDAVGDVNPADKATMLAQGISGAMYANAVSVIGVLLAIVALTIGTIVASRRPDDAPPTAVVRER